MQIEEVVILVRLPKDKTKQDLTEAINKKTFLEWVPRESLGGQVSVEISEHGNAPDERLHKVRFVKKPS